MRTHDDHAPWLSLRRLKRSDEPDLLNARPRPAEAADRARVRLQAGVPCPQDATRRSQRPHSTRIRRSGQRGRPRTAPAILPHPCTQAPRPQAAAGPRRAMRSSRAIRPPRGSTRAATRAAPARSAARARRRSVRAARRPRWPRPRPGVARGCGSSSWPSTARRRGIRTRIPRREIARPCSAEVPTEPASRRLGGSPCSPLRAQRAPATRRLGARRPENRAGTCVSRMFCRGTDS